MAQLFVKLGLRPVGGNYANMKRRLQQLQIDTSHWTGQAWNKGEQLKDYSKYTRIAHLKPHLIKLRGNKCEECKRTKWLKKPIVLEVHHIDSDRTNNEEVNLQLLCPNCHSITDGWRNRK